ncbi:MULTISPECIES: eCIS core domain-containing protein [Chitinophaga]|uniref:eCIS core domain-containing protein n=1 Tax=Chitinophaga TaxID=79328 RepID=UPI000DB9CCC7|nr:DUF4157 domain-containing protein [Chitinophaga ginsengisegetis]MDR6568187.1 hypothetical protein [Chitinophaga ginsengisegetis]MDR6647258.1 hypothetical protein [Chitinophaga ginsengisegetis]MDR6653607.1 hypothetical protein [Chitinophaga ginsengisegetis]
MITHAEDPHSGKRQAATAGHVTPAAVHVADNGPRAVQLRPYQQLTNNNDKITQQKALQALADNRPQPMQEKAGHQHSPVQRKENKTGMPDHLKNGIENISGHSMDDVRVHYNSAEPAQLQALAYAKGTDIHLGPGQEQHLAHEAWHVVQQKQGRVQATTQLKQGIPVNDDKGLEQEADVMGQKALQLYSASPALPLTVATQLKQDVVQRISIDVGKLNVVGEEHGESQKRRQTEVAYSNHLFGQNGLYWQEAAFKPIEIHQTRGDEAGLRLKFFYHTFAGGMVKVIQTTHDGDMPFLMAVRGIWKTLNTVKSLYQEEVETLSHEEGLALHQMMTNQVWTGFQAKMDGLATPQNADSLQYRKELVTDMINLKKYWETKPDIYEPSKAVVTNDRNDHMHNSATTAAFQGRKGIWKVGENHVIGISQMFPAGRQYNLVHRADFNNDINAYIQSTTSVSKEKK